MLAGQDSNLQHPEPKSDVLPVELPATGTRPEASDPTHTSDRRGDACSANTATATDACSANTATATDACSANTATATDACSANTATATDACSANTATATDACSGFGSGSVHPSWDRS